MKYGSDVKEELDIIFLSPRRRVKHGEEEGSIRVRERDVERR